MSLTQQILAKLKNTCSGYPPTNLENYGIDNTGATQNYIKVNTPFSNKYPIKNYPPSNTNRQKSHASNP